MKEGIAAVQLHRMQFAEKISRARERTSRSRSDGAESSRFDSNFDYSGLFSGSRL